MLRGRDSSQAGVLAAGDQAIATASMPRIRSNSAAKLLRTRSSRSSRFVADSPLEGFEPSVPLRKRWLSREAPQPTIIVSRDDLCLTTPSRLPVRRQRPGDLSRSSASRQPSLSLMASQVARMLLPLLPTFTRRPARACKTPTGRSFSRGNWQARIWRYVFSLPNAEILASGGRAVLL